MEDSDEMPYVRVRHSEGVTEYRHVENDLAVLLYPKRTAPVTTFQVTYRVGSRNEGAGFTGSTHLLEHLMFKGSKNFNKESGTSIWSVLQTVGAEMNATTWKDRTNYFETVPADKLHIAMAIESDRMRGAQLKKEDKESEMTVVRNEFERGENSPHEALSKSLWATAYQAHPYHWSTIGWKSDIETVAIERLREFYSTFYYPDNATVSVVGDFNEKEVLQMIDQFFGHVEKAPKPIVQQVTKEPKQEGQRRFEVKRTGRQGVVVVGYKSPEGKSGDTYALQLLEYILANGKNSRFYRRFVDTGLASSVNVSAHPFRDAGLFTTYINMTESDGHERIEEILDSEFELLKESGVTREELQRAQTKIRADFFESKDGTQTIASNLNEAIAMGDWTFYTTFAQRIERVDEQMVMETARRYFLKDQSTVGHFLPQLPSTETQTIGEEIALKKGNHCPELHLHSTVDQCGKKAHLVHIEHVVEQMRQQQQIGSCTCADDDSGDGDADSKRREAILEGAKSKIRLKNAIRVQKRLLLDGALELLMLPVDIDEVITVRGSLLGGDQFSPESNRLLASATASMLDEGTQRQTKFEIAQQLEDVGASISFWSSLYRVRFAVTTLRENLSLVLRLLAEQLQEPAFNESDLETYKKRAVASLNRARQDPGTQASIALMQALYPRGHPSYAYSIDERVEWMEALDSTALKQFHAENYGVGSVKIVVTGDVDPQLVAAEVERVFKGWKRSPLQFTPTVLRANKTSKDDNITVEIPDKQSTILTLGQPVGIDREHRDYLALRLATFALGGNFSARLMQVVRDREGLTYGIRSRISGVSDERDGYFRVLGTFAPSLLAKGEKSTKREVLQWIRKGVRDREVVEKITTLVGGYIVGLETTGAIAGELLDNAERGKPVDEIDQYPRRIEAVTTLQVNVAIRKYMNPAKIVTVKSGTFEK